MSRKPYIKIVYPDASEIAMLLTEAMARRASGKRVVETESTEREHTGQDLFAGTLCCVTETSVELTLNLAPEAMDYALATLIAKNLTQSERDKATAVSDSLELDALFFPAQAAEAPGQALDGSSSPDVPSAEQESATQSGEQEAKIEIGKMEDRDLRSILNEMVRQIQTEDVNYADAIDTAVNEIIKTTKSARQKLDPNGEKPIKEDQGLVDRLAVLICGAQRVTQKCTTPLKLYASDIDHYIKESFDDEAVYVVTASELARVLSDVQGNFAEDPKLTLEKALKIRSKARVDFEALKMDLDALDQKEPSWDDVEALARQMHAPAPKQSAAPRADDGGDDIEPGLLNDIVDETEGEEK